MFELNTAVPESTHSSTQFYNLLFFMNSFNSQYILGSCIYVSLCGEIFKFPFKLAITYLNINLCMSTLKIFIHGDKLLYSLKTVSNFNQ